MRTELPQNFPAKQKSELNKIVKILRENVEVEMVVLYGSYAKGDFVIEDKNMERGTVFRSDFDLMVVVKSPQVENQVKGWELSEKEIMANPRMKTKPSFVVTNIADLNQKLKRGRYFFADIYKEGILLFDSGKYKLNEPVEFQYLSDAEKLEQAEEYFEVWMDKADDALETFGFAFERGKTKKTMWSKAAFELHQATEKLFNCTELTFIAYRPPSHNLWELKERCQKFIPALKNFFFDEKQKCICGKKKTPSIFKSQKGLEDICTNCNPPAALFVKLAEAYVDAQFGKDYQITKEELEQIHAKVLELKVVVEKACVRLIGRLRRAA